MKKSFVIYAMVIFWGSGFLSAQNTIKVSVDNDGIPLFLKCKAIHCAVIVVWHVAGRNNIRRQNVA